VLGEFAHDASEGRQPHQRFVRAAIDEPPPFARGGRYCVGLGPHRADRCGGGKTGPSCSR